MTTEKSIRDKYFANEIFKYGDIVEDTKTGAQMKILDRGSNYVTVAIGDEVKKKWLNEVKEILDEKAALTAPTDEKPRDFVLLENGQIKMFGHVTHNFDVELSALVLEQFEEFDDLYSKHQIIKCLDYAMGDPDMDRAYENLIKVESFYEKRGIQAPFIVEGLKTDVERKRLAEIIAAVADVRPSKTNYQTVTQAIKALRAKYQSRKQWEVLWPLFKLATQAGMDGIMQNLPYTFENPSKTGAVKEFVEDTAFYTVLEENIEDLVEDLEWEDVIEAFGEEDLSEDLLMETLSLDSRNKLSRKMSQHADFIEVRRARALNRAATSDVLMSRARRLAEIMLKRRMFHKDAHDMTRQEKERFESGAIGRRAVVAKLAQRLIGKVRQLQNARAHHHNTAVTHKPNETVHVVGGGAS